MQKTLIECLATGFYVGRIRKAPGTWGTLWGVPLFLLLSLFHPLTYMAITLILVGVAIWVSHLYELHTERHDSQEIVIDEIVGFLVTMTWLPATWQSLLAGFMVFRFLDITKPFPIRTIDRRMRGGIGTVADDLVAGLVANVILQIVYSETPWLGVQLNAATGF